MVLAVVDDDAHVLQREAGDRAGGEHLLDALLHRRNELVRDRAALRLRRRTRSPRRARAARSRRDTSPNWPAPPVCFLWRWWPSACAGDRLAIRDARRLGVDLELVLRCHPLEHRAQVQVAQRRAAPSRWSCGSCSTTSVGSSAIIRCSTSESRCSSPRFFGVIATPCIGAGNSSGRMWMWSSSCESCSTQSNSISSTLATARDVAGHGARRSRRSCRPAAGRGARP